MLKEKITERIIVKWLKKGNIARAMRDILPRSGLNSEERDEVAYIVHHIVRYKNLYDYALENEGLEKKPENYIMLFKNPKILDKYIKKAFKEGLAHVYYSSSREVAKILMLYPKFAERINREPKTHIAVNLRRIKREVAIKMLRKEGFDARVCTPETCVETDPQARYSTIIKEGYAIVQDSSSQHIAKIVSSLGNDVLDYCAGSGGKSFTMKFFNPNLDVYVHDINKEKIKTLFKRADKLGLQFKNLDAERKYDVVLVDAPCSGLGSAARNPEAKYLENLSEFPRIQMEILSEAKNFVKEGGFIVYVVCTFNPDETYSVVERFLANNSEYGEFPLSAGKIYVDEKIGGFIISGDIMYIAILKKG